MGWQHNLVGPRTCPLRKPSQLWVCQTHTHVRGPEDTTPRAPILRRSRLRFDTVVHFDATLSRAPTLMAVCGPLGAVQRQEHGKAARRFADQVARRRYALTHTTLTKFQTIALPL